MRTETALVHPQLVVSTLEDGVPAVRLEGQTQLCGLPCGKTSAVLFDQPFFCPAWRRKQHQRLLYNAVHAYRCFILKQPIQAEFLGDIFFCNAKQNRPVAHHAHRHLCTTRAARRKQNGHKIMHANRHSRIRQDSTSHRYNRALPIFHYTTYTSMHT